MLQMWLTVVLLVLTGAYLKWRNSDFVRTINKIPGPRGLPLVGSIFSTPSDGHDRLIYMQIELVKKYGSIFRLWFANRAVISASSPRIMEAIMASPKFIDKGTSYDFTLKPYMGNGLVVASGQLWKRNRRILTPSFHFRILDQFFDVFNENAEILCRVLKEALTANGNEKPKEIDVSPYLFRATLDVICETAMGVKINAQTMDSPYLHAISRAGTISAHNFFSTWQFFPTWMYRNFSSQGRELYRHYDWLHKFGDKVIQDKKKVIEQDDVTGDEVDPSTGLKKRRPFLDMLLIENKKGAGLSDLEIRNEVDTFMVAGHDTTATLMTWFLYCMATHPEAQALVQEELDAVFGDSDRLCTLDDIPQMKYLDCCVKETLRLYPSIAMIERVVSEDMELEGYRIPAGTSIAMQIYALHHTSEHFPDPEAFKPERFQSADENRHRFAYVPFSAGPRNCIGQRFGLLEAKATLSNIMRRFRFTYDMNKRRPARPVNEIVLKPKGGMPLIVSLRS